MDDDDRFVETFELSKFIPDAPFDEIIDRFENGRTIDKLRPEKNKVLSVEEFLNTTKEETKEKVKPEKMSREELIKHLEEVEKQLEEESVN
jgi:predicted Zn-dependent protease